MVFKIVKCDKCNNKLDAWDYNYQRGICSSCNFKRCLKLGVISFLIIFLISIPLTLIEFNYELDKCDNLNSKASSYDFTNRIEVNTYFNENCYFLKNHPFALTRHMLVGVIMSVWFSGFLVLMAVMVRNFKRIEDIYY